MFHGKFISGVNSIEANSHSRDDDPQIDSKLWEHIGTSDVINLSVFLICLMFSYPATQNYPVRIVACYILFAKLQMTS